MILVEDYKKLPIQLVQHKHCHQELHKSGEVVKARELSCCKGEGYILSSKE